MSKAGYIIVPVAKNATKNNMDLTVFNRDVGYWSAPSGSQGDKTQVGDQIWFVGGKNEQDSKQNAIHVIGNVTRIIDPAKDPDLHLALSASWEGDWSNRKIIVFRILPLLEKDRLAYSDVCNLFGFRMLANGGSRVKADRLA